MNPEILAAALRAIACGITGHTRWMGDPSYGTSEVDEAASQALIRVSTEIETVARMITDHPDLLDALNKYADY